MPLESESNGSVTFAKDPRKKNTHIIVRDGEEIGVIYKIKPEKGSISQAQWAIATKFAGRDGPGTKGAIFYTLKQAKEEASNRLQSSRKASGDDDPLNESKHSNNSGPGVALKEGKTLSKDKPADEDEVVSNRGLFSRRRGRGNDKDKKAPNVNIKME